jgi:hypothetical protein
MKAEHFDDLVSFYFDDALDPEGLAELNQLLATRLDLASRFVHLGRVHGGFRELSASPIESSRAPNRRRTLLLVIPPTLAAAAFLFLVFVLTRPSARMEESQGAVTFDGSSLETPTGGSATIALPDGSRLHAGADTALGLAPGRVTLHRGTLAAEVVRQKPGSSLVFSTPQADVRVIATRLFLSIEVDSTLCRVEEGQVQVTRPGHDQVLDVRGGFYAVATPQSELKAEPVARPAPVPGVPTVRVIAPSRWPKSYGVAPFHTGSLLYKDRGWRITDIPSEVDGAVGIVTLAEDRRSQEERLLVFEIDREADVWVGIDGRAAQLSKKLPGWLAGWESTGLRIYSKTAANSYYHLYRRRFPAGEVVLGGNHQGGDTGAAVNYTVLVTAPVR